MQKSALSVTIILLMLAACSTQGDSSELLARAQKLEQEHKAQDAILLYEELVREHPDAQEAPEALYRSAALYYNEQKDLLKAATTYELVCEKYPDSEFGHRGLFVAAFTYANELGNLERAREAYEKYLREYPDSSMAATASFELNHLGTSAEELLESLQDGAPQDENTTNQ